MIDLSQVRRYYVACGYTDLRRGIDGLAAIVTQQFGAQRKVEGKAALGYRYCTKLFTLEKQYGYATAKSHYEYCICRPKSAT